MTCIMRQTAVRKNFLDPSNKTAGRERLAASRGAFVRNHRSTVFHRDDGSERTHFRRQNRLKSRKPASPSRPVLVARLKHAQCHQGEDKLK
jgi:hypothetical protein